MKGINEMKHIIDLSALKAIIPSVGDTVEVVTSEGQRPLITYDVVEKDYCMNCDLIYDPDKESSSKAKILTDICHCSNCMMNNIMLKKHEV